MFGSPLFFHLGGQFLFRGRPYASRRRRLYFVQQFLGHGKARVIGNRTGNIRVAIIGGAIVARVRRRGLLGLWFGQLRIRHWRIARVGRAAFRHRHQFGDNFAVVTLRLGTGFFEFGKEHLDGVNRLQNQRDRYGRDFKFAVSDLAEHILAVVGNLFQPGQSEETTGALDGMDQAKDVLQNPGIVGVLLEFHQFDVDNRDAFRGFRQKLVKKIVHVWQSI